ncbi:MAG: alpha/beta hydrolase [Bellilinea sp.]
MHNRQGRRTAGAWLALFGWLVCACAPTLSSGLPTETPAAITATTWLQATPSLSTPIPLAQPTATLTPAADCRMEGGRVEPFSLSSAVIGKPLWGFVYLPPCFEPHAEQSYPLLVLLHGQSAEAGQWLDLGLAETADRLIAQKIIPPLVIVLPYEEYSLRNPYESGYDRALLEEVLPWLEREYPAVCRQRECRGLGGLSRGGGWALWIGLTQPDLFAAIGGHSAPPFYGMENRLTLWLKENSAESLPAVYLDVGEKDRYYRSMEDFHNRLSELGIPHEWRVNPGAHDEDYWRAQAENYLRWYGSILSGMIE